MEKTVLVYDAFFIQVVQVGINRGVTVRAEISPAEGRERLCDLGSLDSELGEDLIDLVKVIIV